jgi:hypothetical protein
MSEDSFSKGTDTFSKFTSGLQNIAVIAGLAIGGWWSLQTFVFQNPSFIEQGGEVIGVEPEAVNVDMNVSAIDEPHLQYEAVVVITNSSKTRKQVLRISDNMHTNIDAYNITVFSVNDKTQAEIQFVSTLTDHIDVPAVNSRQLHYLINFPKAGIYLVEVDFCKKMGKGSCLAQKYILAGGASKTP